MCVYFWNSLFQIHVGLHVIYTSPNVLRFGKTTGQCQTENSSIARSQHPGVRASPGPRPEFSFSQSLAGFEHLTKCAYTLAVKTKNGQSSSNNLTI